MKDEKEVYQEKIAEEDMEKKFYRECISELVNAIEQPKILKMIYYFADKKYVEQRAGCK